MATGAGLAGAEELVLEEGAVKKASRHVSQGAGVRAQSATRTGYAHTDEISLKNLEEAARQARAIADRSSASGTLALPSRGRPHDLYTLAEPPIAADLARKLDLLRRIDAETRAADPRIKQVIASLASEQVIMLIATASGWTVGDVRPLTRLNVTTIAEEGGKREIGSHGGGGRVTFDFFLEEGRWRRFASEAARQAVAERFPGMPDDVFAGARRSLLLNALVLALPMPPEIPAKPRKRSSAATPRQAASMSS